jgi:hypothetical protein
VNGVITGIRFYKGPGNTGAHVAHLWTISGARLGTATFASETASGWQLASFDKPIAVNANTTYIASYHAPNGNYAADHQALANGVNNAPLHAVAAHVSGNGVYAYGPAGTFPGSVAPLATNYWVDVVFDSVQTAITDTPLLLLQSSARSDAGNFTGYYKEILQAEGLNAFAMADVNNLSRELLEQHDTVLLGETLLTPAQVTTLTQWVNDGGNLIAMRPDKQLAGLLGLTDQRTTLNEGYIKVSQNGAGRGIVAETIQFHGEADLYQLNGATSLATLYSNASDATTSPAVTLRHVNGGHAVAFTYDLARSVVYTHQGDPNWDGKSHDGDEPIRTNDMFYPNYVNLDKVAIPQADEQQRLLANLITQVTLNRKPLPRFWYMPNGAKAAIVHTLDDHDHASATRTTRDRFLANSSPGCSVEDWECLRFTSWGYRGINLSADEARDFVAQGFELGAHVGNGTSCVNLDAFNLDLNYTNKLKDFRDTFSGIPPQQTHRYHCVLWNDWLTHARVQLKHGIRYSMDYYYWANEPWVKDRPGLFTGSGIPMRFADKDGSVIDIYQGVSQLVNEAYLPLPGAMHAMIDRAEGPEGYYGFFGTHDDFEKSPFVDAVISTALSRQVPVISAQQALTWLDGRNGSLFRSLGWNGKTLDFTIVPDTRARNLQAMLPVNSAGKALTSISRNGAAISFTVQTIKGVQYAFFAAVEGAHRAIYDSPQQPPSTTTGLTIWTADTVPVQPAYNDPSTVELGVKFRSDIDGFVTGVRFYKGETNIGEHVGSLWSLDGQRLATGKYLNESPSGWQQLNFDIPVAIRANTVYVASYHASNGNYAADQGGLDKGASRGPLHALADSQSPNGVYAYGASALPTLSHKATNYWVDVVFAPKPPLTLWGNSAFPAEASVGDADAVELGVKFSSTTAGKIKGIRFYKGLHNIGTHTGTLRDSAGNQIETATFIDETESGWQEVLFANPVEIVAGTPYIASYHAPRGRYAATPFFFNKTTDHTSGPLRAPMTKSAEDGNGVYRYGATDPFRSHNSTNYWVDVLFEPANE